MSGGMRQRVMIAMALVCNPRLLIADEPTTALDVTIQAQILDLMRKLKAEIGMSILFITHDLGVVAEIADRVVVMYAGPCGRGGPVEEIFAAPQDALHRRPDELDPARRPGGARAQRLRAIPGNVPDPRGAPRVARSAPAAAMPARLCARRCRALEDAASGHMVRCAALARARLGRSWWRDGHDAAAGGPRPQEALSGDRGRCLRATVGHVRAVDGVSFDVAAGEVVGLVGESGSGKTTVGRTILRLTDPTSGEILFDGIDVAEAPPDRLRALRRRMQIIFQDPYASLNPRMAVADIIGQALDIHGLATGERARASGSAELLEQVRPAGGGHVALSRTSSPAASASASGSRGRSRSSRSSSWRTSRFRRSTSRSRRRW